MVCFAPGLYTDTAAVNTPGAAPEFAPGAAPDAVPDWTPVLPTLFLLRERPSLSGGYGMDGRGVHADPNDPRPSRDSQHDDADLLDTLEEEIVVLAAHIHAATHRLLVLVAEFDRRRGWERSGHRSCAHWLASRTGLDLGAAREKVRAARALERLPEISAAMARGELSFSMVRALTRVATDENEGDLLELARGCTTAQLERIVRGVRRGTEEDEAEREKKRWASRTFSVFPDDEGMYVVRGLLPPEVGVLLMRAIEAAGDALYKEERWPAELVKAAEAQGHVLAAETERKAAQRRADALGLLAERAMAAGFGEVAPLSGTRAERYQVVLHVEEGTLAGGSSVGEAATLCGPRSEMEDGTSVSAEPSGPHPHGAQRPPEPLRETSGCGPGGGLAFMAPRSHLDDGTHLSAETSRRLSCDCGVVRATHALGGSLLDVGRRTRTIPPAIRRALEIRDRGCRFPGCGRRFAEGHHVTHWADGGETKLDNLVLLCRFHHRLVHEEGWAIHWWREGLPAFYDPRGGLHMEGRWEPPEVGEHPVEALVAEQRSQGVEPDAWRAGARWKTLADIPDRVYFRAVEALQDSGP